MAGASTLQIQSSVWIRLLDLMARRPHRMGTRIETTNGGGPVIVPIEAQLELVRNGVQARGASVGLVGQGSNREAAVRSLRLAVLGWCRGLAHAGMLEATLDRRGIAWETGGSDLEVVIHPMAEAV
jgi:hypothetical protein